MADQNNGMDTTETLHLATEIVAAFVSNNTVTAEKLPALLQEVHDAVKALAKGGTASAGSQEPAVPIKKSITPDYIICLEDGKKLKMLKRYLRTQYNLSPEEYRRKWGLPADYPMVAPNYSKRRSQFAKDIGLGTARTGSGRAPAKRKATKKKRAGRKAA
ncbi:MucR family transcriptional regulator [Amphiplicatus metriothermophilus]|uniref:Transcriptional regulator, MucR family n=1 Tax=Amphiplicatus metriothermophilus TaxID=1519374 RepID=A0A239PPC3_9PROT|nr:MucR family transcriptional regulator [Amphiplicatus metriothermophilus]MBB5518847.1 putative transcriptional regulator [Amphiplicatus metriothermophilus]SNT72000.1 transcriptional regulator, MucR family [Amphiplicatus metriothermophilus]